MATLQKRFCVNRLITTLLTYQELMKEIDADLDTDDTDDEDSFDEKIDRHEYQSEQADECVLEGLMEMFCQVQMDRGFLKADSVTDFKRDLKALVEKYKTP